MKTKLRVISREGSEYFDIPNPYSWDIDDLKLPEKIKGNLYLIKLYHF
jgi:hypothetical protein